MKMKNELSEKEKMYKTINWILSTSFKLFLVFLGLVVIGVVMGR